MSFCFLPNTIPKLEEFLNLRHFPFSGLVSFQCFKKSFWNSWNLTLSCSLFLFSIHFSNLTLLNIRVSIQCSFAIPKLLEVSSLPICTFSFILKSSLLVLTTHCCSCCSCVHINQIPAKNSIRISFNFFSQTHFVDFLAWL